MTAVHDPIDEFCGASWEYSGPLQDADEQPLPLTGASITWSLVNLYGSNVLTLSLSAGITVIDLANATILVNVTAAQTAAIAPGSYKDVLVATLADGTVLAEWTGVIRASPLP
jgi:hypothetical protein